MPAKKRAPAKYSPSRLDYFVAAALSGILAAPVPFKTTHGGTSISKNAVIVAKATIAEIDKE